MADSAIENCIRGGGATGKVIDDCTRALAGSGLSPESRALGYWTRASAFSTSGRLKEAIDDYTRAIDASASFQPAYAARGAARFRLGETKAAVADYDAAIKLDPTDPRAFHNRAVALRSLGQNERAIEDYSEALQLDGFNAESLIGRGVAFQAVEDHSRAVADFTSALRLQPRLASAYSNRGVSYRALGREDRALEDFEMALRVNPSYVRALVNRGAIRRARGDTGGALADFDRAIALDERFAGAFFNRGLTHFMRRQFTRASADLARAAALQKDAISILWLYLSRSRDAGELGDASSLSSPPGESSWPSFLAAYLVGRMTQTELLKHAQQGTLHQRRAQWCEALFFAGQKSLLQRRELEATKLLEEALESCPKDFIEYEVAVAELDKGRQHGPDADAVSNQPRRK